MNKNVKESSARKRKNSDDFVNSPSTSSISTKDESPPQSLPDQPDKLLGLENKLSKKIQTLLPRFKQYIVYNPLEYAAQVHATYVNSYCKSSKKILIIGENPGPWGMCQTGVPFGEIDAVRDWLQISGPVGKPPEEHPKKLILGFDCHRREQSGKRLFGYFRELCGSADNFLKHTFLYNYCPITLLNREGGKYVNLKELKKKDNEELFSACDDTLIDVIKLLGIELILAMGNFAEQRAKAALEKALDAGDNLLDVDSIRVLRVPHPSPMSQYVRKGKWNEMVNDILTEHGLMQYFKNDQSPIKNTTIANKR
ncbi:single-strand selective monofunctional uracil DNA glycosylase [Nasonia vitripennis]|uniref:Uracil-DNA glycosylase-like domain-containing protein n=1 Tax=Nasonia vitripennis TaxID=7425 RepID=A0A7M7IYX1_NASVI|nr:single-strand selective monofunctional uracil DNA glycosylase [Nasonia vitripennis]